MLFPYRKTKGSKSLRSWCYLNATLLWLGTPPPMRLPQPVSQSQPASAFPDSPPRSPRMDLQDLQEKGTKAAGSSKEQWLPLLPSSPIWMWTTPKRSLWNLGGAFEKLIFLLYIMENTLLVLENTLLTFLCYAITRSFFSWVGMENTHTGWVVKYYFKAPLSVIHQLQSRDSLLLISVKRFSGPFTSFYLWTVYRFSMMIWRSNWIFAQSWGYNWVPKHPQFTYHSSSLIVMFSMYIASITHLHTPLPHYTFFPSASWPHFPRPDLAIVASQSNFYQILEPVLITLSKQHPQFLC